MRAEDHCIKICTDNKRPENNHNPPSMWPRSDSFWFGPGNETNISSSDHSMRENSLDQDPKPAYPQ